MYVKNKLSDIYSKLIFRCLLLKLTTKTLMFVSQFYKQTDRCTMDRPLSAIFSAICMTKTEREDVHKSKPKIKNIFLNDIINRRRY